MEKKKLTFGDWFLIFIGASVALVFVLQMLGKIGLIDDPSRPWPSRLNVLALTTLNACAATLIAFGGMIR